MGADEEGAGGRTDGIDAGWGDPAGVDEVPLAEGVPPREEVTAVVDTAPFVERMEAEIHGSAPRPNLPSELVGEVPRPRGPEGAPPSTSLLGGSPLPSGPPTVAGTAAFAPASAVLLAVGAAAVAGMLGFLGGRLSAPAVKPLPPAVREAQDRSPSVSALTPGETALERAARGDAAALRALEAKPDRVRSVAETVSLARGREAMADAKLEVLARRTATSPAAVTEPALREAMWELVSDARTATRALEVVAAWPGPHGPDFIYRAWTSTSERTPVTRLAEELAYSPAVRAKASPALSVALDLRRVPDCDTARALVGRAEREGDPRSLHLLGKLAVKTGCGAEKRDDCYPCLREEPQALASAIRAVGKRQAPRVP